MSLEFEGTNFVVPSSLFTDLEDPASRERFKALMQFQYDFSDEEIDRSVDELRKKLYWLKVAPELLVVVVNDKSDRASQVGTLMGYLGGEFVTTFGDQYIEKIREEDILLIMKSDISPQAGIKVKFLDESRENILKEGILTGYEKVEERKSGDPFGWYVVQVGEEVQKVKDWRMLDSNIRFLVEL